MRKFWKGFIPSIFILILYLFFPVSDYFSSEFSLSKEEKTYIEQSLSLLTAKEYKELDQFFKKAFFLSPISYTLFGSKPMSTFTLDPIEEDIRGLKAWKKVAPFYSSSRFVIRDFYLRGKQMLLVADLNKIEAIYHENREILYPKIGLQELKSCLIKESELFQTIIHDHLSSGILFGFGSRNAKLFDENFKNSNLSGLQPFTSYHPIFSVLSGVSRLYFVCEPSSAETRELQKRYKREREKIIKMSRREPLFYQMLAVLLRSED